MGLRDVVQDRLAASALAPDARQVVLEAFEGDLTGNATPGDEAATKAFLKSITVNGFRGIGPKARLPIEPGPGLTLVVGRNGSGKSSFAEGVEVALTGTNRRWDGLPAAWKGGWRNLHVDTPPAVTVEIQLEGIQGTTTIRRRWDGDRPEDSQVEIHGATDLSGWGDDLVTYRPFLSYSELGKILTGKPKEMHDAIAAILGLEQLASAETRLAAERSELEGQARAVSNELAALLTDLDRTDDPRARVVHDALSGRRRDLDAVTELAAVGSGDHPDLAAWRRAAQLSGPDLAAIATAVEDLRQAATDHDAVHGTAPDEARRLADLLTRALDHHDRHQDEHRCPVCRTPSVLDTSWAEATRAEVARLRDEAAKSDEITSRLQGATHLARATIMPMPAGLKGPLAETWQDWLAGRDLDDPLELAGHIERHGAAVQLGCEQVRATARLKLAELEDRWRPLAVRLAGWVPAARTAEAAQARLKAVKAARAWLTGAANDLRNEQLRPMAERSAAIWAFLRQESNVALGPVTLAGTGVQKRVELDVQVDGSETSALGVMSQGELHSLALALFLPRVLAEQTPFGFVVIDDPVQSMDPGKVDGLAQVLALVAEQRQVVVFTHDTRLPEAVKRLQLPATVLNVTRREHSVVAVTPGGDEVSRALDDARAIAKSADLPAKAATAVVAGLCRTALEATFVEVFRRNLLGSGASYLAVEQALENARSLSDVAALAAFGQLRSRSEVGARLNRYGVWADRVFGLCNKGVHGGPLPGDLAELVTSTARLVKLVRDEW